MKKLLFVAAAFGCSTSFCMDVVFSNPTWSKSIAVLEGHLNMGRTYSIPEWDEISPEFAKNALLEMITLSWQRMSPKEKNDCLLNETEIFAFNQIPEEKAKILLAETIESGLWMFCEKNPSLIDRISNEWRTLFRAKRAHMLLDEIVDSFFSLMTIAERRIMLQSKIYDGECKIPVEKSLMVLDKLPDDIIREASFETLKDIISVDPDVINGMPKEEFWKLPDEEWRKFHSFEISDTSYDTTSLRTDLLTQIGDDPVAQEAFQLFLHSRPRALINFFCDNHAKMILNNGQRFKELSILITPGVESKLHEQKMIQAVGSPDSIVSTDFQFLPFCTDMLFAGAVESAKQGYFTVAMMYKDAYNSVRGEDDVEEGMYPGTIFEEDWEYIDYDLESVWRNLRF
jgi:hypothetical protein